MARPRKCRRVCCLPRASQFGPLDVEDAMSQYIHMTVDEYETIRLIDLEGLMQEECSVHMKVARTTVQSIYNSARKKLAESLVLGKRLCIEGGEYQLCEKEWGDCQNSFCGKKTIKKEPKL